MCQCANQRQKSFPFHQEDIAALLSLEDIILKNKKSQKVTIQFFKKKLIEFYDCQTDPIKNYFLDKMQSVIFNFNKSKQKIEAEEFIANQNKVLLKLQKQSGLPVTFKSHTIRNLEMRQKIRRQQFKADTQVQAKQKDLGFSLNDQFFLLKERQALKRQAIKNALDAQDNNIKKLLNKRRERSLNKSLEQCSFMSKPQNIHKSQTNIKTHDNSREINYSDFNIYQKENLSIINIDSNKIN